MNGCRWQEKSFSVAVTDDRAADKICNVCKDKIYVVRKHNGNLLCLKCFDKIPPINSLTEGNFYTTKDKLWEFTSIHVTGKPTEIRTKGQWKRFLKENNKHDDISKRDMDVIKKNHERNRKETEKKNIHEAVVEAYRYAKQRR